MRHLVLLAMVLSANGNLLYPTGGQTGLPSGLSGFAAGVPSGSGTGGQSPSGTGTGSLYPSLPGTSGLNPSGAGYPSGTSGLNPSGVGYPSGTSGLNPSGVGYPSGTSGLNPSGVGYPSGTSGLNPSGIGYPSGTSGLNPSSTGSGSLYPSGIGYPSGTSGLNPSGVGYPSGTSGLSSSGTGSSSLYPSGGSSLYPIGGIGSSYGGSCDEGCRDTSTWLCLFRRSKCSSGSTVDQILTRRACPKTCGVCTPCTARDKRCEPEETCFDAAPEFCKYAFKGKCSDMTAEGVMIRQKCRVSCDVCWPCKAPPIMDCEEDCKDNRDDCQRQAFEKGRCRYSEYSPWMESNCRLSCGFCQKCKTPPLIPTTKAPPPPPPPKGYSPAPPVETSSYSTDQVYAILTEIYNNQTQGGNLTAGTTKKKYGPEGLVADKYRRVCTRYTQNPQASVQEQCLAAHNYFRCLHNAPALIYDDVLAASATAYASKMATRGDLVTGAVRPSLHDVDRGQNVGENLAARADRYHRFNVYQAVSGWYAEAMKYDYENPGYSDMTQHFTQLVWKGSSKVGCGVVKNGQGVYIVAHYEAAGNVPTQYPANVVSPSNVCKAKCARGTCQSHDEEKSDCNCGYGRLTGVPMCSKGSGCVVFCPKPRTGYYPSWNERCSGASSCTCNYSRGFGFYRRRMGATCT